MKSIGILYPSIGETEDERQKLLPKGVSLHMTKIPMMTPGYDDIFHLADSVEEAASRVADAGVDIIGFSCTLGSLIKGKGYDQEIMNRISQATGLPATTTTTAVVAGLRALGIERLVMVSPYVESMNEIEKAFLEDIGFQVLNHRGLGLANKKPPVRFSTVEPSCWYKLIKETQHPGADGYFVSCSGIRVVDIIQQAETDLGKPVITSTQALVWHCLRKIGLQEPMEGFGRLMKIPLLEPE